MGVAEGKIKADGTIPGHRAQISWSAHWLGDGARHRPKRCAVPLFCETSMFARRFAALWKILLCFCIDHLDRCRWARMTKIASDRGLAASAPMAVAVRPPRVSSPEFARSPASMAQERLAHLRLERVAGPAAERAARSAQAVACDVGAALPSFAAAPWVNADGATANRAPGASWSSHAPSVPPGRTDEPLLISVIFSATAPRAMASAAGCIRRRRTGPTARRAYRHRSEKHDR